MTAGQPTSRERAFLRAIAAVNPAPLQPGESEWWSATDLQHTPLFPDFRHAEVMPIAGLGKSCTRKGLAVSRHIGTRGHGWTEWRVSSYGRGLVSDSCIGGGLRWERGLCPACRATPAMLGIDGAHIQIEIPAHPLPGHDQATATPTATGETR